MSTSTAAPPSAPPEIGARVAFVGAGPGDLGLLTVRARDYLARADTVVVDDPETGERLAGLLREDATVVHAAAVGGPRRSPAARAKLLVREARALKQPDTLVVRVMAGDPGAFTTLSQEALACRGAGVPFEVVPGVSIASSVPTYAGVPLTSAEAGEVHIIDAADSRTDWSTSVADGVTVVLLGSPTELRKALSGLRRAGRDPQTPVCVTEHGTTVEQRSLVTDLGSAEATLAEHDSAGVVVVGRAVEQRADLSWFETKALFGWNVLVPRTRDQAGTMTQRIASHGASSKVVPTISVEPPRTPQQMDRAIRGLVTGRYEWIGFTSVNAVRAVREKFTELGLDARSFAGLKIAAVGGVTADALREWGIEPDLIPSTEQSARGLLADWPEYDDVLDPIDRVFLPRADIATDTLVAGLIEMGWEVDDVTAYRTVRAAPPPAPIRDAIKGGAFDAVCFTSSSTVRNLVGIAGKPHPNTVVACIGPATAKTAEEHGLRVDVVAPEPNAAALVDALARHGAELTLAARAAGEPVRPSQRRTAGRRGAARVRA
ncbi:bifunctional uroporphyrinogen-III C-methyltransferase/uroporphyrinogen-III synthase [Ornithinimicrobium ciconiae]|uniref:uroporphyrinogen-III synthase n=1 Tax=Ornithinimicrobium ciconiae TaxID=2594265 RepID=UPI0013FCFBAD|nr:uroporphyrinogen-III synthase [Ornithinimicrobium ciconiae]